eukprot:CAMPEP_0118933784 /NCGR_PEP_ID=MMETSP1169-20130426/12480_1 /TAXON_ID=36882 /ORGANISM="Pyramimonas obovata, Strain CCMP722" /LENGTH=362 /DNA_ID=CAMNT_0006876593 /DNA_START=27 /DNA_END=1116 /DNA_ORIENTATION=+
MSNMLTTTMRAIHSDTNRLSRDLPRCPALPARIPLKALRPTSKSTSRGTQSTAHRVSCAQTSDSAKSVSRRDMLQKSSLAMSFSIAAAMELSLPEMALAFENPANLGNGFQRYYGRATSASSYGGYGGTETEEDAFKYYFDVPSNWKSEIVTKQEKGYQGVDARFSRPEKGLQAFLVTFPGYTKLKEDKTDILDDLAIADATLQDTLAYADEFTVIEEKNDEGQLFVKYDVIGESTSLLVNLTTYGGRLYVFFVKIKGSTFDREMVEKIRNSFENVKKTPQELAAEIASLRGAYDELSGGHEGSKGLIWERWAAPDSTPQNGGYTMCRRGPAKHVQPQNVIASGHFSACLVGLTGSDDELLI